MQILLQDEYNIGVLTVNIECMWLGTKRMERLAKSRLSPISKPRHINYVFTVNLVSWILEIHMSKMMDVYTKESTCEIILFMVNKILTIQGNGEKKIYNKR